MLEDRPYMRRTSFDARRSATILLLIINVVAFVVQLCVTHFTKFPLHHYFALSLEGLRSGYVWQLLTFQLMHGGWFHLFGNCLGIFIFGRSVEEALGKKKLFWALYLLSGIIGGLVQVAGGLVVPRYGLPVVGASAGGFGLIAAFATLFPDRVLMIPMFLLIPVTMKAKFLIVIEAVFALIGMIFPYDNIAHAAHLGGLLAGIGFIKYAVNWNWDALTPRKRPPLRLVKVNAQKSGPWGQSARSAPEDLPPDEFLRKEVDPILDKISEHGIQSLTEGERRILEAAGKKIGKR